MKATALILLGALLSTGAESLPMSKAEDHTQMWWAEGFPNQNPGAPWLRKIETGYYTMALNTGTLAIEDLAGEEAELELKLTVDGETYLPKGVEGWTRWTGPRLVESGRFFQRMDVTDVIFESAKGKRLSTEARFEVAAWPDRLGLILSAQPGIEPIAAGESSFGKVGGGYGLDGMNELVVPHEAALDPEQFQLELDAFIPTDYRLEGRTSPWLVCKNRNEAANGNFGIMIINGRAVGLMNIDGAFRVESKPLRMDQWSKLALSYDGDTMRLLVNGKVEGEKKIGKVRKPGRHALAFGRREDNHSDGYHFRGVIDEVKFYDLKISKTKPVREWGFRADGHAAQKQVRGVWKKAKLSMGLKNSKGSLSQTNAGNEVSLVFDPVSFQAITSGSAVVVKAGDRPVEFHSSVGWHRVNLDGVQPVGEGNDVLERIKFQVSNPSAREEIARLMFEKTSGGFRHRMGTPITGVSAILRDANGEPTGIPVQLSKNWHNDPSGGVYAGQWFHGITQLRLPPGSTYDFELILAYGHWGGVAAASHAQLSLIGWGGNSLWEQSAMGAWGESICYDPDQAQANVTITDVRPVMVTGMGNRPEWGWTQNMGGGDFFRFFNVKGDRLAHKAMRTTYHKYGPCLTEVTYAGKIQDGLRHQMTVSLGRTDDLVRGTYRIRLDVDEATDFSRFVIFQVGSDTYNFTREHKFAVGEVAGLTKEWDATWGGDVYQTAPMKLAGNHSWVSMHDGESRDAEKGGASANRGFIIRDWKARIGGKEAAPWIAERGVTHHRTESSIIDLVPPPGVTRLEKGDFIEATIVHLMMPQKAEDYYGPNGALRNALTKDANSWKMIQREAGGNAREVEVSLGTLERRFPDVRVKAKGDRASLTLSKGLAYVPVTFTGLSSAKGFVFHVDGEPLDQSVHGNDFWQTDFDADTKTWSRTYNVPFEDQKAHVIELVPEVR